MNPKLLSRLLDGLGGEDARTRAKSEQQLLDLGHPVVPALREALPGLDADVGLRVRLILSNFSEGNADERARRAERGVAVLKQIGTPRALALLRLLRAGEADDPWTKAARAAKP
jgi:hypothetical protein